MPQLHPRCHVSDPLSVVSRVWIYNQRLRQWLVGVVCLAVGEEEVDDHADDGEEEDNETPDQLVHRRAVGFQDLNEDDDVENKDDEADDATTSTVLPRSRLGHRHRLISDGSRYHEGGQAELEEEGERNREHVGWNWLVGS